MSSPTPATFNFTRDIVEQWSERRPRELALCCVDEAKRAAHVFHRAGVRRGDRVLVMLPRVPLWWIGMLGLIRLGAVPIPATTLLTPKDIAYRVEATDIATIFTDA